MKKLFRLFCLAVLIISLSGCALLKLPFEMVKLPLALIEKALQVAQKLPKPPPGVFGGF